MILFICFWLHQVFVATRSLSAAVECRLIVVVTSLVEHRRQ